MSTKKTPISLIIPLLLLFCSLGITCKSSHNNQKMIPQTEKDLCIINIVNAGLTYRTKTLLDRESESFFPILNSLCEQPENDTSTQFTYKILERNLKSKDDWKAYNAAFLAGRSNTEDEHLNKKFTNKLVSFSTRKLNSDILIELGMSLVLRGELDKGKTILLEQVANPDPLGDQYKAAFYLAQLGDLSGYPAFVKTLNHQIPHYRLMALRHLIVFLPFDGTIISGININIKDLFLEKLYDENEFVRCEVPFYLEESKISDLHQILQPVAQNDSSELVRNAAKLILNRH